MYWWCCLKLYAKQTNLVSKESTYSRKRGLNNLTFGFIGHGNPGKFGFLNLYFFVKLQNSL